MRQSNLQGGPGNGIAYNESNLMDRDSFVNRDSLIMGSQTQKAFKKKANDELGWSSVMYDTVKKDDSKSKGKNEVLMSMRENVEEEKLKIDNDT